MIFLGYNLKIPLYKIKLGKTKFGSDSLGLGNRAVHTGSTLTIILVSSFLILDAGSEKHCRELRIRRI